MSLTLDPLTDTFVEVGTEEFAELLYDPYLSHTFTSPLDSVPPGKVNVTYGIPPTPISQLPPLPPGAMKIPDVTQYENISNTFAPLPSISGLVSLPPLKNTLVENIKLPSSTDISGLSPLSPSSPLPFSIASPSSPLSPSPFSIASPRSMETLPPLPTF